VTSAGKWLNVSGLVLDLVGVLLLFRYGMPYRVAGGSQTLKLLTTKLDITVYVTDLWYTDLGQMGLGAVLIGTLLQIWAAVRPEPDPSGDERERPEQDR
jgi:hypothetical protein